jgi:hypothetical protein
MTESQEEIAAELASRRTAMEHRKMENLMKNSYGWI